jgi:hypothetical protein
VESVGVKQILAESATCAFPHHIRPPVISTSQDDDVGIGIVIRGVIRRLLSDNVFILQGVVRGVDTTTGVSGGREEKEYTSIEVSKRNGKEWY